MVNVIDHAALRFSAICLATPCKSAVICSMSLGDIFADANVLSGFVIIERSIPIAFSNVTTWNSDEATTGSDGGGRSGSGPRSRKASASAFFRSASASSACCAASQPSPHFLK